MDLFIRQLMQPLIDQQVSKQLQSQQSGQGVNGAKPKFPLQSKAPIAPITPTMDFSQKPGYNPFMVAMQSDSPSFEKTYGVNQPLQQPMFLGYDDNRALYGGSRLFILY